MEHLSNLVGVIYKALQEASRLIVFLVGLIVGVAVGVAVSYALPPIFFHYTLQATVNAQKEHISTLTEDKKRLTEEKNISEAKSKEYEGKLSRYVSDQKYRELEEKYGGEKSENISLKEELAKWKGGTFPIDYILIRDQPIKILGDLPIELEQLHQTTDGKLEYAYLKSPALGSSWAKFYANTETPFMHKDAVYKMRIELAEFERIRVIINRER